MNESCHYIWMSHVTMYEWVMSPHMNQSCHIQMSHVTTYEGVMSQVNESCHIWMSHVNLKKACSIQEFARVSAEQATETLTRAHIATSRTNESFRIKPLFCHRICASFGSAGHWYHHARTNSQYTYKRVMSLIKTLFCPRMCASFGSGGHWYHHARRWTCTTEIKSSKKDCSIRHFSISLRTCVCVCACVCVCVCVSYYTYEGVMAHTHTHTNESCRVRHKWVMSPACSFRQW